MTEPTNAELAHRLLLSCRLGGFDPARDAAPTYPAVEEDAHTTTNALLAAITHAMLAIAEALGAQIRPYPPPVEHEPLRRDADSWPGRP